MAELEKRRTRDRAVELSLGEFIRDRRADILHEWLAEVRQLPVAAGLDRPMLLDHIPDVLDRIAEMADSIAQGTVPQAPDAEAAQHADSRLDEGFDLPQVVTEFAILRDCVMRLWEQAVVDPGHLVELRVVNQAIDKAVTASVTRFTRARDRTMLAIDRIASEALESRSLDELLQRLLKVFVEFTAAVDTAAILIREGDELRVRAALGLHRETELGLAMKLGEGFAGTIAHDLRPLAISPAETAIAIKSHLLRTSGIRALYGLPLIDGGNLVGVAHMGSLTAAEFSRQDRRLMSAMANRATAAIYQHVLRETAERSSAELSAILESMPAAVYIGDAAAITRSNRAGLALLGYEDGAQLGRHGVDSLVRALDMRDIDTGHRLDPDNGPVRSAISGKRYERDVVVRDHSKGVDSIVHSVAGPISRGADVIGAVAIVVDVTARVTEQRFLDTASRMLSSSLDVAEILEQLTRLAVPDIADWCMVDVLRDGGVERVAVAHRDPEIAADIRTWAVRFPPDLQAPRGLGAVLRTGQPEHYTELTDDVLAQITRAPEHQQRVRELGIASCIIAPLVARGQTLGAVTLMRAGTRTYGRSKLEMAIELGRRAGAALDNAQLYRTSQDAIRAREEIIAVVSHDLRSPLAAIDLAASLVLASEGLAPKAHKHVTMIERSANRMERLLRDLLDTTSIQVGRFAMTRTHVDAGVLLTGVTAAHEELAAKHGIDLVREADLGALVIDGDLERLIQALGNLVGNAIKFSQPGDVVAIRGEAGDGRVRFEIADSGPGISPDELPHIFEPYWSAKRHAQRGTGLGLYICKSIVEMHGGTLSVSSEVGRGTTFVVELPAIRG